MSNREIEATLKLSTKLGPMGAFGKMAAQLKNLQQQSEAVTRAQKAHARVLEVSAAAAARMVAPAALAYGGKEAMMRFAEVEKRMVRTGLVLGATRAELEGLQGDIQKAAKAYALSTDDILGTMDAYAAAGAGIGDIRADLDGLAKAQQALGADGGNVVQSWDAARKTFSLASKDAERFFSIIAAGSAAGKVEAKDLAQMLPETLPIAARYGLKGTEGVERLVAALETMADFKGSPAEAATSLNDFLEKISSPDVERNFRKFGVDLPRELKKAKAAGEDLFETMSDLIAKATKGDATRLSSLFGDKEARSFADLLLSRLDRINAAQKRIRDAAPGILDRNNAAVLDTLDAKMQKLSTSWDNIVQKIGEGLGTVVEPTVSAISDTLDFRSAMEAGAKKRGLTWAQQQRIVTLGSAQERGLLAYDGGWRVTPLSDKGPMHLSPELPSRRQGELYDPDLPPLPAGAKRTKQRLPGDGAPIPGDGLTARIPELPARYLTFRDTPAMAEGIRHESRVIGGFTDEPVSPGNMRIAQELDEAFRSGGNLIHQGADDLHSSMESGGQSAAAAMQGIGPAIGAAIAAAMQAMAPAIGTQIAATFNANAKVQAPPIFLGSPAMQRGGGPTMDPGTIKPAGK